KRRERESQRESPGTLFQDEAWTTCLKRINPLWLLAFRVFSFAAMLTLLISNVVRDGGGIFYFYTQWTFTLVTVYFGYGSLLSIYGCCIYSKEADGNIESYTSIGDAEQGTYRPPITLEGAAKTSNSPVTHSEAAVRETAGFWVYIFQVLFQANLCRCCCANRYRVLGVNLPLYQRLQAEFLLLRSQLDVCMHSLNAVFLLGDTCLNSLRFPLFRVSYFVLWSCIFVAYQWIIHVFKNLWWPYQFLDLSSPYAPLWYVHKLFTLNMYLVLGGGSDAYTVLRRLCFDHKAEEFLATASQLVMVLGSTTPVFILLRQCGDSC
ncbi:unnamed protein product, partial [Thlaspi arvense]